MFGRSWNTRPKPWPQKSRTTLQRSRFGIGLDGGADIAGGGAGPDRGHAPHQRLIGDLDQPLGGARDLPTAYMRLEIAVPAVDDEGHVDIEDVALLQRAGPGMPWQTTWLSEVQIDLGKPR